VRDAHGDRRLRRAHAQGADELHRAAPRGAVHPPDLRRRPLRAAAHRPAALHSLWRRRARPARRSDAGGAARGLVRRELLSGALRKARGNARAAREALTVEVFMSINETLRAVEAHGERRPDATGLRDALASTHKGLFGIIGAIESTFTRDEAWHFFKLGAALERIYRTALILRAKLPALTGGARPDQPLYYTQWRSLLRSVSSLENYRRARGAGMEGDLVV